MGWKMRVILGFLSLVAALSVGSPSVWAEKPASDCQERLEPQRAHFLKRLNFVRLPLSLNINSSNNLRDAEFWHNAVSELKREQAGFSEIYLLPKGDQRLSPKEKARLFLSYSSKFTEPSTEEEWSRFYFNHLQSLIAYASVRLKEAWIKRLAPDFTDDPEVVFDAAIFPRELEDCTIDASKVAEILHALTPEVLTAPDTQRRIQSKVAGAKPCCKVDGGCLYCAHNRRQLR